MRLTQTHQATFDRRSLLKAAAVSAAVAAPGVAVAQSTEAPQPKAKRSTPLVATGSGNLSPGGIARLHDAMTVHIENGRLPGLVTLVSRRGETHADAIGTFGFDDTAPMRRETIFRIASVTKPTTAVAAMMLIEECKIRLDDPVDALLPELADRKVLKSIDSPLDDTVPANRPITIRDLMTFRAGYGAVMVFPEKYPIQTAMREAGVQPGATMPNMPPDELMKAYGSLPLVHQPGEQWLYNSASDILGVLIARASGQSLGDFFRERIFEPLGMKDTAFSVPGDKISRLPTCYWTDFSTGETVIFDKSGATSRYARPQAFESGAGGLVSTADDLLAFAEMMINDGVYEGTRLISRPSVELMTTDQITPEQKAASTFFPGFWDRRGWGFGVSVITRREELSGTPGRYGWDGGYGTSWYVDPSEGLIGVLLTQRVWDSPVEPAVVRDFWASAYAAIDD